MADIMVTFAHDFTTKWEMEAFARQDMKGFEAIKDQLVELGMTDAKHGVLFGQKDNYDSENSHVMAAFIRKFYEAKQ